MISFIKEHVWPIIGVIATIVGLTVAFFPSLFNLEQKKIVQYTHSLNTLNDAQEFINFLQNHQNSIVNLDITYFETERYRDEYDEKGNIVIDDNADMDGTPKKQNLNEYRGELSGKESYGVVDKNGYIFIKSEFNILPFLNDFNFLRKKGGIGIWIPGRNKDGSDDKIYRIIITEASKNNTLFKWSIKDRERNMEEMQLSGTFFVNTFIDTHDSDYGSNKNVEDTILNLSPQWREMYSGLDQIGIQGVTIVELDPLSKKEIESKNY